MDRNYIVKITRFRTNHERKNKYLNLKLIHAAVQKTHIVFKCAKYKQIRHKLNINFGYRGDVPKII